MNHDACLQAVVTHRHPMTPGPTNIEPSLPTLTGIRAVIFDVYGTLMISGSGDVGTADQADKGKHIAAAMEASGLAAERIPTIEALQNEIGRANDLRRCDDCPAPEVDIVAVWSKVLDDFGVKTQSIQQVVQLAAEYESRANPTWPMPDAADLITRLGAAGRHLGIVSNAQVFTLPLVRELGEIFGDDAIFDIDLSVFSNRFRQSKPGPRLFQVLVEAMQRKGLKPTEAIYVGNDMLNDVWAASQAGLRTAWFAGDRRSCRPRSDDTRCRGLNPDIVLTSLMQLLDCLEIQ